MYGVLVALEAVAGCYRWFIGCCLALRGRYSREHLIQLAEVLSQGFEVSRFLTKTCQFCPASFAIVSIFCHTSDSSLILVSLKLRFCIFVSFKNLQLSCDFDSH